MMDVIEFLKTDFGQNLLAEAIGIVFTVILVSWIGGYLLRRIKENDFEKRWKNYRLAISHELGMNQDELDNNLFDLGRTMVQIAEKDMGEVSITDLDTYREKCRKIYEGIEYIETFFEKHHFALRLPDISVAQGYLAFTAEHVKNIFRIDCGLFDQFERLLSDHLQGLRTLDQEITYSLEGDVGTRKQYLIAVAEAAVGNIKKMDNIQWQVKGKQLIEQLSS